MPEEESPPSGSRGLSEEIGAKERRKARARRTRDRTLWHGLGAAGVVGWSVAVPTVLGVLLGVWIDRNWPGPFSWSLALLLAGVTLGCLNAWYWVNLESKMIEEDEEREGDR
ncbi:MAG: AtpZ/AtpI family protein [Gammaproteobacteria bacterium]|jgi:ATP synthase protein I|nr:AtpZ/AtpI family protein [Gammaproteobacteria bacterium]